MDKYHICRNCGKEDSWEELNGNIYCEWCIRAARIRENGLYIHNEDMINTGVLLSLDRREIEELKRELKNKKTN